MVAFLFIYFIIFVKVVIATSTTCINMQMSFYLQSTLCRYINKFILQESEICRDDGVDEQSLI